MEKRSNFIKKANTKHNNFYDYSLVKYKNNKTKIIIICPIHGEFEQRPDNHLYGYGCKKCGLKKGNRIGIKKTNVKFIKEANIKHNNFYDYSLVEYKNNSNKIKIICPIHGEFEQRPSHHLKGASCSKCSENKKFNNSIIIEKANNIHNNYYNYSLVEYKNMNSKIKIICPIHGIFEQTTRKHLYGRGCPKCKISKGERIIEKYLLKNNILFERQKSFKKCKYKQLLYFDFYLTNLNICIEFDGEQHFKKYRWEKNENNLKIRKIRDNIKNKYCENNNIQLIRIKYNENIEERLNSINLNG